MKTTRFQRWIAFALALPIALPVVAQSLRDAVDAAVSSNPEILATVSRRLATGEDLNQARGGYFPRVDLTGSYGQQRLNNTVSRALALSESTVERHNGSLTVSQMLFDGFAVSSEVDRQRSRYESSGFRVASASEDIALRVVGVYLEVVRRQETAKMASENYAAHERIFDLIRRRTQSGVGRRADLDQAESRLAFAHAVMQSEYGALRDATISFSKLVGRAPETLEPPVAPIELMPRNLADAIGRAASVNPLIKGARSDIAAALAEREGARAALMPRVDLEVSASRDYSRVIKTVQDTSAALVLRYNLLRGGSDAAHIRSAGHAIEEAQQYLGRAEREVNESVSLAYSSYATARARNVSLQRYVDSAEATRKAYATQFTIGQRTLLDLLNSENEYFNAQLAFVQGRYTELASVYRALASIGILNQSLKVATACCNSNAAPASAPPVVSEQPNPTPRWMLN